MTNPHSTQTYADLDYRDVQAYLEHKGWEFREQWGTGEEWEQEGDRVLLVKVTTSSEYPIRMSELVETLARKEGSCKVDVIRRIERRRVRHPDSDDSVLVPDSLLSHLSARGWMELDRALEEWGIHRDNKDARYKAVLDAVMLLKDRAESSLSSECLSIPAIFNSTQDLLLELEELPFRRID